MRVPAIRPERRDLGDERVRRTVDHRHRDGRDAGQESLSRAAWDERCEREEHERRPEVRLPPRFEERQPADEQQDVEDRHPHGEPKQPPRAELPTENDQQADPVRDPVQKPQLGPPGLDRRDESPVVDGEAIDDEKRKAGCRADAEEQPDAAPDEPVPLLLKRAPGADPVESSADRGRWGYAAQSRAHLRAPHSSGPLQPAVAGWKVTALKHQDTHPGSPAGCPPLDSGDPWMTRTGYKLVL
jgi:hypothetical protein